MPLSAKLGETSRAVKHYSASTMSNIRTDEPSDNELVRHPFLARLGERVRTLRARRGLTRRLLSQQAGVSERHLANLESGAGNPSVLVLLDVARALDCPVGQLLSEDGDSAERPLLLDLLEGRSDDELRRARLALAQLFGDAPDPAGRGRRIALVGLRGAGKSTLGRLLAQALERPFVELNTEIERVAGCPPNEIHALYGATAWRRYERRALEETIELYRECVIATPGGLVSEPATLNLLLAHCHVVWLQAAPEEHMRRVVAQGDLRPMAGNAEAMDDLRRILAGRAPFYAQADDTLRTDGCTPEQSLRALLALLPAETRNPRLMHSTA